VKLSDNVTDTPANLTAEALIASLWRLPLPANTLPPYDHTNSYVLLDDDNQAVVVDVGSVDAAEMLIGWLTEHRYDLEGVLLTHAHSDHVLGLGRLLEHTSVPVHVHALEQDRVRQYGAYADMRDLDMRAINDGDVFTHGEFHIYSVHTPGHSPGHVSFVVHDRNRPTKASAILAGDMVTDAGAIWVGTPEGDLSAYLQSLTRLAAMSVNCLAPSHGAVSWQPRVLLDKAKAHKEAREQQVLGLLEQPTSLADLTDQLYPNVPNAMRDFAERSLAAHLSKLLNEGRIHKWHGAQRQVRYQRHKLNT
jgi:endoribonuclease LACTB2